MQPPKLWERVGLPAPTWQQVVCLIAVVSGGLAYGGLTDVLAEPGTRLYTGLAWPRLALRYWRQQLRAGDPGTLGLTLIAAAAVICVAAMLTSSARKCWYNTYMDTLAREMVMSGAMRPTRSCEAVASSVATAVHGDCPSTFVRLLDWGFQLFRFYLGMCGGALLVGWLLFGGSVPAYGLPSFRGYTGYSGQWIVRPPPPICLALLNVSGSNNSSVGGAYTPAEAVLDGVTYALTPQLVAAVKEVADLGGGFGGWWQRLQLASRINLLAVRTFRSRGLDGVQAALEALRAARELSPFIISGQATNEYEEVYAQAVSVLQGYPLHHGLTEEDYARHTDVKWYIGSSIWSLGLACEKLYVRPLHFPRSSSVIAAGASSGGGMRSEVRGGNRAMGGALTGLTEADLLIDAGPTHAAPSAPPPPMCDARSVLDRALTGAWHCTAALGQSTSRSPATSAASRASQRRATADNTKVRGEAVQWAEPEHADDPWAFRKRRLLCALHTGKCECLMHSHTWPKLVTATCTCHAAPPWFSQLRRRAAPRALRRSARPRPLPLQLLAAAPAAGWPSWWRWRWYTCGYSCGRRGHARRSCSSTTWPASSPAVAVRPGRPHASRAGPPPLRAVAAAAVAARKKPYLLRRHPRA